jgi:hypothetical protein
MIPPRISRADHAPLYVLENQRLRQRMVRRRSLLIGLALGCMGSNFNPSLVRLFVQLAAAEIEIAQTNWISWCGIAKYNHPPNGVQYTPNSQESVKGRHHFLIKRNLIAQSSL